MVRPILLIVLMIVNGLAGAVYAASASSTDSAARREPEVWLDSRVSDEPLRGDDVVRRDISDLPAYTKSWVLVIDGSMSAPGNCAYSLDFLEPVSEATPKIFWMSAVDTRACRFEFVVGVPARVERPNLEGGEYESYEVGSGLGQPRPDYGEKIGYMHGDFLPMLQPETEALQQLRFTVYAEWKDIPTIVVNQVLSAVKVKIGKDGKFTRHHCRHDRWWKVSTGWQNTSNHNWGETNCNEGDYNIKASTNARFKNPDFPLCRPTSPAVVYYDRLSARAVLISNGYNYHYNIVSTWQEGCGEVLVWANFHFYPGEYWGLPPS